jgi:hypothetical protein
MRASSPMFIELARLAGSHMLAGSLVVLRNIIACGRRG